MTDLDNLTAASLDADQIKAIQVLEKKLGVGIRLVAVAAKKELYAVEAKLAPNEWRRIDKVYPEIEGIKAYYLHKETAVEVKSWLKVFLNNNTLAPKPKKRPIRIRRVSPTETEPS
jgi:hypothetical protein